MKYFFWGYWRHLKYNTMSSTRHFIQFEGNHDCDYYKMIEDEVYFRSLEECVGRGVSNFRVHGKHTSIFHAGRIPNEYYCLPSQAMKLRSGKKINYIGESFFWFDAKDFVKNFDGSANGCCFHLKKAIWFYENYYYLMSTSYELANFYDTSRAKIKEFLGQLERSVKGVYMEREFTTEAGRDGELLYNVDFSKEMPARDIQGKYVFCNCRYVCLENGKAIEQEGHHADEFLPKLRKLTKMYSKPHRIVTESQAYKIVDKKINDDCRGLIFSYLSAQDLQA